MTAYPDTAILVVWQDGNQWGHTHVALHHGDDIENIDREFATIDITDLETAWIANGSDGDPADWGHREALRWANRVGGYLPSSPWWETTQDGEYDWMILRAVQE